MSSTNQTADDSYDRNFSIVQAELKRLQEKLDIHRQRQKNSPQHWTHAGDLGYVFEKLGELNKFLC